MDSAFPNDARRPDGSRGFRGNSENAKTRLCTRWLQGDCRFGERCNFAHGETELRKGDRPEGGAPGGYSQGPAPGRGGGRGGGYPARGGMGPGGYPGPGRGRGMYGGDMGYGGGGYGGGGYGMPQQGYGGPMDAGGRGGGQQLPEDVWAAQGYPVAGPNGWYMYRTKETGEAYFHNHRTNQTIWERPPEWPASGPGQM